MENNENNMPHSLPPMRIRKVNVEVLLSLLQEMFDRGIDYVDIYGQQQEEENHDMIGFSFSKEYMNEEYAHNFDNFDISKEDETHVTFKSEDLDDLI